MHAWQEGLIVLAVSIVIAALMLNTAHIIIVTYGGGL